MRVYQILEITGLAFIILSFYFSVIAVKYNESIIKNAQFDHISIRLNELHSRQFELEKVIINVADQLHHKEQPNAHYLQKHKYHTNYQSFGESLKAENTTYSSWQNYIYIIGSLMLILGKYLEYGYKNNIEINDIKLTD